MIGAEAIQEATPFRSDQFSLEQKEYLRGFFSGIEARVRTPFAGEMADGRLTHDPSSGAANLAIDRGDETFFGTPVDELCREERWKHESNPLDVWDQLMRHAQENRLPDPEFTYRFKYFGLFHVAPAQDSFMLRMRVPGCILRSYQMRGLAEMAEDWGAGECHVTTRGNLQIRELEPKNIVNVLMKLDSLGMSSKGSGADNIRNITATPTTGLDPAELYDVAPLARALEHTIRNSRDMYGLPRKFNVAFDSGGAISVVSDTNDIGFIAVRVADGKDVPAGIYFRMLLCGITGHRQFASDTGLLVPPEQTIALAAAMIRVFNEHGDRTDRKKARLKYLVEAWGMEKFLAETEKKLAFPLLRVAAQECEPRAAVERHGHLGVHAQKQPGLHYIGVVTSVGRMSVDQMRSVASIADEFGSGELRLTVWQNLLVPNVPTEKVEAAKAAIVAAGLHWSASTLMGGVVACTGSKGCKFSSTDTKAHALALSKYLDERFKIDQPVNLHVTGCPNSCAQHYVGDIGLMGMKVGGEEGYQVFIGGGCDQDQALAREILPAVKFADLGPMMERLFLAYTERRRERESFLEFTRRHEASELKAFCETEAPPQ